MNILERAGLGHIAARITPEALAAVDDRFDLASMRREQADRFLRAHRCWERYGTATVDVPKAAGWVGQVLADDPAKAPTLLITGPLGTGKTRLAWAVMSAVKMGRAAQGRGCVCRMVDHADFDAEMHRFRDDEHVAAFEKYAAAELLVLDDIAATRSTEWAESLLHRLVQERWTRQLPTVAVSNLSTARPEARPGERPLSPFEAAVGGRVAERLLDAVTVVLAGPSRRLADARRRVQAGVAR